MKSIFSTLKELTSFYLQFTIISGFAFFPFVLWGQNLVKNPSFENYVECPEALGVFHQLVTHWSTPTEGSSDYFNTCSKIMGAPENFNGVQYPKDGAAYAGVYFYAPGDYREYLQAPLHRTLRKGRRYQLEFYVSLAEGSDFAVRDFGVVFSYKPWEVATRKTLSKAKRYQAKGNKHYILELNQTKFHEDKSVWLKINSTFEAKGYENFVTLGNFEDNANTQKIKTKRKETKKGAYYYIDAVAIRTISEGTPVHSEIIVDSMQVLENVHFPFDDYRLAQQTKRELVQVIETLHQYPHLYLELHGYTDNLGTAQYNAILSKKRARAIAEYLVAQGIATERITWFGHASAKPRASNATSPGRAKNRRVEFVYRE
ncbi:MAG: OmpA family protein [Bacteroidota bacterium]